MTLHKKSSKRNKQQYIIPCKPIFKIVEDEFVVGVLTETNQFIQLSEPIAEAEIRSAYLIESFRDNNYIVDRKKRPMISSDSIITTSVEVDQERVDYIEKVKYETNFYNVFRNTIRILLNDYENSKIKERIENEILKSYIVYTKKLHLLVALLKELVSDKIQFTGDKNYYKIIKQVSTCIVKDSDSCENTPNLCALTDNGKCRLILPQKNLLTGKINEPIYFTKMADELIRYNKIKSFMLQPQTYLSFEKLGYNLRDNEIIVIQSLLNQEYFDGLIPAVVNKYVKYNSHDEAEPIITQEYDNLVVSSKHNNKAQVCEPPEKKKIIASSWSNCFPSNYKEVTYKKSIICTFTFIIDLIEKKIGKHLTINQIKNSLFEEYKKYLERFKDKIVDILILEGKKTLGDQVKADTLTFASFLFTDNYFITPFDIWLLIEKYDIPTIFISSKDILQTNNTKDLFVAYGEPEDSFAFIIIPTLKSQNIPGFKFIESADGNVFIPLNNISSLCNDKIKESIENKITIENYLQKFTKMVKASIKKPSKKPSKKPLIIEEDIEDRNEEDINPKKSLIIEEEVAIEKEPVVLKKKTRKNRGKKVEEKRKKNKPKLIVVSSSSNEII